MHTLHIIAVSVLDSITGDMNIITVNVLNRFAVGQCWYRSARQTSYSTLPQLVHRAARFGSVVADCHKYPLFGEVNDQVIIFIYLNKNIKATINPQNTDIFYCLIVL